MLIEDLNETGFFNPNEIWLHGGPSELKNNVFERGMRQGKDAGGIFFAKDDEAGLHHALGYAIKAKNGGVWYCKIHLKPEQVFDYSNENHLERLQAVMDEKDYDYIQEKSQNWSIVWLTLPSGKKPEQFLIQAGFRGAIVKAKSTGNKPNTFVCVFVPADVEIINFVPKDQLIPRQIGSI
jgi:hypothetical protein